MNLKTEWDLTPLFPGDDDLSFESSLKEIKEQADIFINKWKDNKKYLEKAEVLKEALDEYELWAKNWGSDGKLGHYFSLRLEQDKNNSLLKAKSMKINELSNDISNRKRFFFLNLSKVSKEKQKEFVENDFLKDYKHFLESLFASSPYLLSDAEERIMTLKAESSFSKWVEMVEGLLAKEEIEILLEDGKKEKVGLAIMLKNLRSKSKEVRDFSARAINEVLVNNLDVAEAEINAILLDKKIDDELRGLKRPDLARHLADDIESEVVDSLIESVTNRFDIPKKFYEFKAKLLGLEKLEYHERNVDYGEIDKKYDFDETASLVMKTFHNLDSEFSDILKMFLENGQVDVYPKKGKPSGAFCSHDLPTTPTYILLNHADKLDDVLTLAHEAGHGVNAELMKKNQNSLNIGTPKSTAEVASTFMEDFVLQEIEKEANEELNLVLKVHKLEDSINTIFRQIACYNFEKDLHKSFREKGYLSKEEIGELFSNNMIAYMGDFVIQNPGSENWWVYWSHIRMMFYVYSYASGLLISKYLQRKVKENPEFIQEVKKFLSAGTSKSPKEIFLDLGIDITNRNFWESGIKEIEKLFNETEELAKKLGKI